MVLIFILFEIQLILRAHKDPFWLSLHPVPFFAFFESARKPSAVFYISCISNRLFVSIFISRKYNENASELSLFEPPLVEDLLL